MCRPLAPGQPRCGQRRSRTVARCKASGSTERVAPGRDRPAGARRHGHWCARRAALADCRPVPRHQAAADQQRHGQGRRGDRQWQPDHGDQCPAGRRQELHLDQSGHEHCRRTGQHRDAGRCRRGQAVAAAHAGTARQAPACSTVLDGKARICRPCCSGPTSTS